MPLAAFYVSIHEVRALPSALYLLKRLDDEFRRCCSVRVGLLANWLRWKNMTGYLELARRLLIPIMVDNGGFQGATGDARKVVEYARWVCRVFKEIGDYYGFAHFLAPDVLKDPKATLRLHELFYSLIDRWCPAAHASIAPVLQGRTPEEYAELYREYLERNWLCPSCLVAVGGLKPHGWRGELREKLPLPRLLDRLLDEAGYNQNTWHLLGIHGKDLETLAKKGVLSRARFSADSGSQGLNYRFKHRTILGCKTPDTECYLKSIEREVRLSLKPLLNRPLEAYMHEVRL